MGWAAKGQTEVCLDEAPKSAALYGSISWVYFDSQQYYIETIT